MNEEREDTEERVGREEREDTEGNDMKENTDK